MRLLSARLIISLIIGVTLVSLCSSYYEVLVQKRGLRRDVQRSDAMLGDSLARNVERDLEKNALQTLHRTVQRYANRENLAGLAVYSPEGNVIEVTAALAPLMNTPPAVASQAVRDDRDADAFQKLGTTSVHIVAVPLHGQGKVLGVLAIVHDVSYIRAQSLRIWRETFLSALAHVVLIALITLLIVRWSIEGPIARTAHWMRALRTGRAASTRIKVPDLDLFRPLAREVATFAESLTTARSAAETEARLREEGQSQWTADRLAVHVRARLQDGRLFVVSNREPYRHIRKGRSWEVTVPPSGLVTALEPVLCACDGTWVAHGNGDADLETVDQHDRLRVPPEDPRYTLRRVWLTKEEEQGYYYGFANEGLWPLCHIAHTRPIFRADDWSHYQAVNRKFADALLEEMEGTERPVVLVQDYHFALVPRMIKQKRPDARVAIFWHIPWPNPEAFSICPWQRELVDGLLGADLIGFHIQSHCTNFLQTVDRIVESRIDWEHFSVQRLDHNTTVKPFPISVAPEFVDDPPRVSRAELLRRLGIQAEFLGVGVERIDYTKGLPERIRALRFFFETYPEYRERLVFVQLAAPSRGMIDRYQEIQREVEEGVRELNQAFQTKTWRPFLYLKAHHEHRDIWAYYRHADFCMVTSLHDGMNLVAKEFVSVRDDEDGALILSRFAGASHELRDALIVNPYDLTGMAEAIRTALEMSPEERRARMVRMRHSVLDHNIYRWAGMLLSELARIPVGTSGARAS